MKSRAMLASTRSGDCQAGPRRRRRHTLHEAPQFQSAGRAADGRDHLRTKRRRVRQQPVRQRRDLLSAQEDDVRVPLRDGIHGAQLRGTSAVHEQSLRGARRLLHGQRSRRLHLRLRPRVDGRGLRGALAHGRTCCPCCPCRRCACSCLAACFPPKTLSRCPTGANSVASRRLGRQLGAPITFRSLKYYLRVTKYAAGDGI